MNHVGSTIEIDQSSLFIKSVNLIHFTLDTLIARIDFAEMLEVLAFSSNQVLLDKEVTVRFPFFSGLMYPVEDRKYKQTYIFGWNLDLEERMYVKNSVEFLQKLANENVGWAKQELTNLKPVPNSSEE